MFNSSAPLFFVFPSLNLKHSSSSISYFPPFPYFLNYPHFSLQRFLNDYGLIWVGEGPDSSDELEPLIEERVYSRKNTWTPEDNILSGTPINLDLIFENLKDLNILAGEGESKVEHTTGGARLKQRRAIPLTFYQNGIVMFNGPFRPYEEPSTQRCLRDIMDGYFPSELQRRYPDGVPFQVCLFHFPTASIYVIYIYSLQKWDFLIKNVA
uniref:UBX domain-containing protein 11 n=1 Tax=Anolis carolinensis TaxID=28377 RepID=A0A803THX8_ANOCA